MASRCALVTPAKACVCVGRSSRGRERGCGEGDECVQCVRGSKHTPGHVGKPSSVSV